jgi:hypothetical protein
MDLGVVGEQQTGGEPRVGEFRGGLLRGFGGVEREIEPIDCMRPRGFKGYVEVHGSKFAIEINLVEDLEIDFACRELASRLQPSTEHRRCRQERNSHCT